MNSKAKYAISLLPVVLLLAGCNSKELTRSKARDLIAASSDLAPAPPKWNISVDEFQCGMKNGLWQVGFMARIHTTDAVKGAVSSIAWASNTSYQVALAKPMLREIVDITGITDAPAQLHPNTKIVQYTWRWKTDSFKKDYPHSLVECMGPLPSDPIAAEALLKLFDDGWRVEHLSM